MLLTNRGLHVSAYYAETWVYDACQTTHFRMTDEPVFKLADQRINERQKLPCNKILLRYWQEGSLIFSVDWLACRGWIEFIYENLASSLQSIQFLHLNIQDFDMTMKSVVFNGYTEIIF